MHRETKNNTKRALTNMT